MVYKIKSENKEMLPRRSGRKYKQKKVFAKSLKQKGTEHRLKESQSDISSKTDVRVVRAEAG